MEKGSKINTFFVEMIILILFFAIAMAIGASLFARAYQVSEKSSDVNMASIKVQSIVEEWKASNSYQDFVLSLNAQGNYGNTESKGYLELWYDKEWNPTENNTIYKITMAVKEESRSVGEMQYADVQVEKSSNDENILYQLNSAKYLSLD